jgi:hypothetical protein
MLVVATGCSCHRKLGLEREEKGEGEERGGEERRTLRSSPRGSRSGTGNGRSAARRPEMSADLHYRLWARYRAREGGKNRKKTLPLPLLREGRRVEVRWRHVRVTQRRTMLSSSLPDRMHLPCTYQLFWLLFVHLRYIL